MAEQDPNQAPSPPEQRPPGRGDALAIGIGCFVFVLFFGAIVLVGILRG